ncbi:MAG TPA: protease modulator HflC [Verrucomicrobiae bacterium]|jgi:modulator of FtsH protease HflC|nr:protease modulator HflC [Verrucomicrobiae bacterium]
MKRNVTTIIIGAVLVVIFVLLLFTFQVRRTEIAVVTTFGKPVRNIDEPGLYLKWPWPIQHVYKFDNRIQNLDDKFNETLTADSNPLIVTVYVGWRISDAKAFYPKFPGGGVANAERMLEEMVRNAKNAVVGSNTLSSFVNADPSQLKFGEIENDMFNMVQSDLDKNNYGMNLEFLGLKKIELPQSVTQAVFDRMKANRQEIISHLQSQGTAEAMTIRSAADSAAAKTIADATAEAIRIRAEGEAEAAKTLPTFEQNPELANFLFRIDAITKSLNQKSTLIFDERTPPFDLFQELPTNSVPNP